MKEIDMDRKICYKACIIAGFFACLLIIVFCPKQVSAISPSYEKVATSSEVVVVYNSSYNVDSDSDGTQDSLQIANYYKNARAIPVGNVIGLAATTTEEITRSVYNSQIKSPLESALIAGGLASSTKYIVLVKGVPLKIRDTDSTENGSGSYLVSNYSSVDAAVCLLFQSYSNVWVISNPYYNYPGTSKDYRFKNGFYSNNSVKLNYLVTRLDGRTLANVKAMIDRGVSAGSSSNRAWMLDANAGGAVAGYDQMGLAYSRLKNIGENVVPDPWISSTATISTSTLPVVGYSSYGIHAGLPQNYYSSTLSLVSWSAGAVSVTYESYNAYGMANSSNNAGQGQIADFIAVGGSGGIGNVYEPWTSNIADEEIWSTAYALGYAWADSAYMSLPSVDFVSVVLGDPLMTIGDNSFANNVNNVASALSGTAANLSWASTSVNIIGVKVVRKIGSYPADISDGVIVYDGSSTSYSDTTVIGGNNYYYRVFAYNSKGSYASGLGAETNINVPILANFSATSNSVSEGVGQFPVLIQLNGPVENQVTITLGSGGTATNNTDYVLSTDTITFAPSQLTATITVNIIDDRKIESDETLLLSINEISNDVIAGDLATQTVTIINNDSASIVYSTSTMTLIEGGTGGYGLSLSSQPDSDVTILLKSASSRATVSTSSLVFTTNNWSAEQSVVLSAVNNSIYYGNENVLIGHSTASSDQNFNLATTSISLVVNEDDEVGILGQTNLVAIKGSSSTLNYRLKSEPRSQTCLSLSVPAEVGLNRDSLCFSSSNWSTNQSVILNAVGRNGGQGSYFVVVGITASSSDAYYNGITSTLEVLIIDHSIKTVASTPSSGGSGGGGGGGITLSPLVSSQTVNADINKINETNIVKPEFIVAVKDKSFSCEEYARTMGLNINPEATQKVFSEYLKKTQLDAKMIAKIQKNVQEKEIVEAFVVYGTNQNATVPLADRAGAITKYYNAFKKTPVTTADWEDVEKISLGQSPKQVNKTAESAATRALQKIFPKQKISAEAIKSATYGLKDQVRDLKAEQQAIKLFVKYNKKLPKTSADWNVVNAVVKQQKIIEIAKNKGI